jgi:hypothetical protein
MTLTEEPPFPETGVDENAAGGGGWVVKRGGLMNSCRQRSGVTVHIAPQRAP